MATSPNTVRRGRECRCYSRCYSAPVSDFNWLVRTPWLRGNRSSFHACLPSGLASIGGCRRGVLDPSNTRSAKGSHDAVNHACDHHSNLPHRLRRAGATCASAVDGAGGWRWQEPVLDGSLSTADRAVLALARAAANLSDKLAAEQAAAAHGLSLVTNSDVCVGPLLPPFGSTLEDDGEEGDGMALPAPPSEPRRQERGSSAGAGAAASALLSAVFAGSAADGAKGAATAARTASAAAAVSPAGGAATRGAAHYARGSADDGSERRRAPSALSTVSPDAKLRHLALLVAEGCGGDEDEGEDEEVLQAFGYGSNAATTSVGGRGRVREIASSASGFVGAAAAALTRAARSAAAAAAMDVPAPVGRAAAGAASVAAQAAQAAVATAAKATAQMLPNYGDPTSSWLVADDLAGGVRYIVVAAGGDLHRRTSRELTSDLATFETYNLGVKVNRRLYAEATALYARFMPLVMDFLEAVPDGNICFGGQGLGGSLAVLLQLMCCHRGLRFARLLPAVAVDAPAVLGQVPRAHRRMWGAAAGNGNGNGNGSYGGSKDSFLNLPQDTVEDVLEDLMQRSVLEELGLPQDAVRNLVLPPPPPQSPSQSPQPPTSSSMLAALYGRGQPSPEQQQKDQQQHGAAAAPVLVMTAVASTGGGLPAATGGAASSTTQPQIFRLVGKVVHVETIGSVSSRVASASASASASAAAVMPQPAASSSTEDAIVEADGGSGDATAAMAAASSSGGFGAAVKRLDAAMVGSIASAAATAAASAAVERLRYIGVGALRSVASADVVAHTATRPTSAPHVAAAAVAASSIAIGPVPAPALPMGSYGSRPLVHQSPRQELGVDDEDASVWGM